MAVSFGIDQLLLSPPEWKSQRIGLITNDAATTFDLEPSRTALLKRGFALQTLFSPEHGLHAMGADGKEIKDGKDPLTGLFIISLYSNKLAPSDEDFSSLDLVLFDIPDIGSRFYTYLWTLTHVMEACAKNAKKLVIADRPNPVSGKMDLVEGPMLDEKEASFIGRWAIPIRHSCTLGELALYFNKVKNIGCNLEVVPCNNWKRNDFQPDWGNRFVPTSPAIQSFESMLFYPGLCLLEATNISVGRGTNAAFRTTGAPWMESRSLAGLLYEMGLDEVGVSVTEFTPSENKYVGLLCHGLQLQVRDYGYFQPVSFGMLLLRMIKQMYPKSFSWDTYPTMVNPSGTRHLDKLLGIGNSEEIFDLPLPKFIAEITKLTRCRDWENAVSGFLLYE